MNSVLRETETPLLWAARGMKHAVDLNRTVEVFVEDGVWKPPYQTAATVFMNLDKHLWKPTNLLHAGIDAAEELFPEPHPVTFVPTICLVKILSGFRRDHEFSGHTDSGFSA